MFSIRLTINGARRTEDYIAHTMLLHYFQQGNQRAYIVAVVHQRFFDTLAYRLACRKVNDRLDVRIGAENLIHGVVVVAINIGKLRALADNGLNTIQHIHTGVAQVIHHRDIVPLLHELDRCMRAYISGTTGYKYS